MLNGLDLFSGIGGIALALAGWVRPVAYCEIDRYAQGELVSKMGAGALPVAPIWDDVRTLDRGIIAGHTKGAHDDGESIDIITGGFPCQDISVAGTGAGLDGERSSLFWEIVRLTGDLRPAFVFLENVPAITTRGGVEVVGAFTALGYDCRWCVVSAANVGANHKRERWFLLAHANRSRELQQGGSLKKFRRRFGNSSEYVAKPSGKRPPKRQGPKTERAHAAIMRADWWATEPGICNVSDGLSKGMDSSEPTVYNGEKEVSKNASASQANPREILPELRFQDGAQSIQWQAGGFSRLPQEGLLRSGLHGGMDDQGRRNPLRNSETDCNLQETILRDLRNWRESCHSSQGRRLEEQRPLQFHDAVRFLSHVIASRTRGFNGKESETALLCLREVILSTWLVQYPSDTAETAWQSLCSEEQDWSIIAVLFGRWWAEWPNVARIAHGIPHRVDRIRALGNAVVPLQARTAFEVLLTGAQPHDH